MSFFLLSLVVFIFLLIVVLHIPYITFSFLLSFEPCIYIYIYDCLHIYLRPLIQDDSHLVNRVMKPNLFFIYFIMYKEGFLYIFLYLYLGTSLCTVCMNRYIPFFSFSNFTYTSVRKALYISLLLYI